MQCAWESALGEASEADAHWYDTTDAESSDDDEITPSDAAAIFIDFVLNLVFTGGLSAKSACVAFWWAGKAGVSEARKWGFRPDAPTGHFQRHLNCLLGSRRLREARYHVDIPAYQKHHRGHLLRRAPVQIPYEVLDTEARDDPLFEDTLSRAATTGDLPACYTALAGDGPLASPIALYTD